MGCTGTQTRPTLCLGTAGLVFFSGTVNTPGLVDWMGITAVCIPDYISGVPVADIGDNAMSNQSALQSVTIGNKVWSIGDSAFEGCIALTTVTIASRIVAIP